MTDQTPTPRTDGAARKIVWVEDNGGCVNVAVVQADFARELERENAALRAALTSAHGAFSVLIQYADDSDGSCYGTLSTGLVRAVIGQVDGRALVEQS